MPPGRGRWLAALLLTCSSFIFHTHAEETNAQCGALGFYNEKLACSTCDVLAQHIGEGTEAKALLDNCKSCCRDDTPTVYDKAVLQVSASDVKGNQDFEDFVRRKAPMFPNLEVEYLVDMPAALEFTNADGTEVVRTKVDGWKSYDLVDFVSFKLRAATPDEILKTSGSDSATGKGTAEIQSCAGWRLNSLPEVRSFIKDSGEADSYKGLQVNFINGHNPDLVFFDEHAKEVERIHLDRYQKSEIHDLLKERGFERKETEKVGVEIRTCMGWQLNQLPEVSRFVKEFGNADAYIGLKINYQPGHHPVMIFYDEEGEQTEQIDMQSYSAKQLHVLLQDRGFKRKIVV